MKNVIPIFNFYSFSRFIDAGLKAFYSKKIAPLGLALTMCSVGQAATISVHPGDDLAAAVAAAAPGDVVEVARGKYLVNLLIDKPLTLRGIDRPTISGGNTGDTIRVTAPDVVLEGLIVSDSGDSLKNQNSGIYLYPGSHRAIVRNCYLSIIFLVCG